MLRAGSNGTLSYTSNSGVVNKGSFINLQTKRHRLKYFVLGRKDNISQIECPSPFRVSLCHWTMTENCRTWGESNLILRTGFVNHLPSHFRLKHIQIRPSQTYSQLPCPSDDSKVSKWCVLLRLGVLMTALHKSNLCSQYVTPSSHWPVHQIDYEGIWVHQRCQLFR